MANRDGQVLEFYRHVYEKLKGLPANSFRKVFCALIERSFYHTDPIGLDSGETAIYNAYMQYFPRLTPVAPPVVPNPPAMEVRHGLCSITADSEDIRYAVVSSRDVKLKKEKAFDIDMWLVYVKPFEVKEGDTVLSVLVAGKYSSEETRHVVTADEAKPLEDNEDESTAEDSRQETPTPPPLNPQPKEDEGEFDEDYGGGFL